ncbi:MAG: hypothetical protein M1541_19340 [Acidobacteria bacterium]|nr:hypothetical protein [Acidobacteriota bacterium]
MSPLSIRLYAEEDTGAVADFNQRLRSNGIEFQFSEDPTPKWLPPQPGNPLYMQYFVAVEGPIVRGGYLIKHQPFFLKGQVVCTGNLQLPLSEGIIDNRYRALGPRLVQHALQQQPLTYALGLGGLELPLPRLLRAMRWQMEVCPFFFYVCHPLRFLRQLHFLRRTPVRRFALNLLAFSGVGYAGIRAAHRFRTKHSAPAGVASQPVGRFEEWVNKIWERAKPHYSFIAVRDLTALQTLYPEHDKRFHRLRVQRDGSDVGWAVVMSNWVQGHRQFGDMQLGSVVDCLAGPGQESAVVEEATRVLRQLGSDLIVTNQLHQDWGDAFRRHGYLSGPSNFVFAVSPALAERLQPFGGNALRAHMTRGDGDGPIHL